jgi:F-type H+-transporting ATPase subunit b
MKLIRWVCILVAILLMVGASVAFGAEAGGHGEEASTWTTKLLAARVVNAVILIIVLIYFLRAPLANYFGERKRNIERELAEAKAQRAEAERTIEEYKAKIAGMEAELEKMRADLQKAAEAESHRVIENADRMAEAMIASAQLTAEQEVRKAKAALRDEAVELAVQMAESLISEKITDEDQQQIMGDYLAKVGGMK